MQKSAGQNKRNFNFEIFETSEYYKFDRNIKYRK